MIGDHLSIYTFEYLMEQGLSQVPNTIDKRQGSIVYDSIAKSAKMLEMGFDQMRKVYKDTFAQYSEGEALELRTTEGGVPPKMPSKAIRRGLFVGADDLPCNIPIGSRFSTAQANHFINFKAIGQIGTGNYEMEAEIEGVKGNDYIGSILPIDTINGLKSAMLTDIIIPGEDKEDDESLRAQYFDEKNSKKFGGNIAQYREIILDVSGVSACQIYPTWDGGCTVKVSVIDSTYAPASQEFLNKIQALVDPTKDGQGLGLAPIDHIVTMDTPKLRQINVEATLTLATGYTLAQLKPLIVSAIDAYLKNIKEEWGTSIDSNTNVYSSCIYASRITAAIVSLDGVLNAKDVKLNGESQDIELSENALLQELPILGVVSLGV